MISWKRWKWKYRHYGKLLGGNDMRSIFLDDVKEQIIRVYAPETVARLKEEAGLEENIYNKEEIMAKPGEWNDVEYIFSTWGMPVFKEEEIKAYFPKLKAVFYAAGSVQFFARPFLNCGVKVFSAWAANGVPVAEYATAQIVLANKGFFRSCHFDTVAKRQEVYKKFSEYPGNYGVKVGIIGAGMIGKMVIQRLKAFEISVLVFDPFLPDEKATELGVTKTSLEAVFSECQVVSNHLANNEQTRGMLNYPLFASMLPNATFINTGRGAQIVEEDLIRILKERPDLTAILDVTDPEPSPDGYPFYELDNCILTPHIAGSSGKEVCRMAVYMLEEFRLLSQGMPCRYDVTWKMLETMA